MIAGLALLASIVAACTADSPFARAFVKEMTR